MAFVKILELFYENRRDKCLQKIIVYVAVNLKAPLNEVVQQNIKEQKNIAVVHKKFFFVRANVV